MRKRDQFVLAANDGSVKEGSDQQHRRKELRRCRGVNGDSARVTAEWSLNGEGEVTALFVIGDACSQIFEDVEKCAERARIGLFIAIKARGNRGERSQGRKKTHHRARKPTVDLPFFFGSRAAFHWNHARRHLTNK